MLTAKDYKGYVSGKKRGPGALCMRGLMWFTEGLYTLGVNYRNRQFDSGKKEIHSISVPVVSVGNMTLGGTGKTPMVAWLASWLRQQDIRVSLISRGYGAEQGAQNDEAKELEQLLPDVPHLQNPDRVAAAEVAIEELATQFIVLDDAYQHRRIARDLDIVLIDATEPFGFNHVFPRGTLREPLKGFSRAAVIVLTRGEMVSAEQREEIKTRVRKYNQDAIWIELRHKPAQLLSASGETRTIEQCHGKKVAAFCAIGNPAGFRHTVESCEMEVTAFREYNDHHLYEKADIDSLTKWLNQQGPLDAVLCTHKDLVKIGVDRLGEVPLFALTIEAEISGEDVVALEEKLLPLVQMIPEDLLE
ncbi:MAG: tetraacyldisaccharide 4'-kinase [Pirellulales bacterium]